MYLKILTHGCKNYITSFRSLFHVLSLIIKVASSPGKRPNIGTNISEVAYYELGQLNNRSYTTHQKESAQQQYINNEKLKHGKLIVSELQNFISHTPDSGFDMLSEVSK